MLEIDINGYFFVFLRLFYLKASSAIQLAAVVRFLVTGVHCMSLQVLY